VLGGFALLILPPERKPTADVTITRPRRAKEDYPVIFKTPAFWFMGGALLLCNLPIVIALTQLNLILVEKGASAAQISVLISAFAGGTLVGRLICGVALDRFAAQIVAAIGMGLPCIGLFLLASSLHAPVLLGVSVLLIGLAFGAEGDLMGYLVVRIFGVRIYSSVLGLMTAITSLSASLGALLVGLTLSMTGNYSLFLSISGATVLIGSFFILAVEKAVASRARRAVARECVAASIFLFADVANGWLSHERLS
jgi:predicted MFS family arabinose efflux permease